MNRAQVRKPFIVVDGPDAAGKTTLVRGIVERYLASGIPALPVRNPAGTKLGAAIRQACIEVEEGEEPDPQAQFLCQVGSNLQLVKEKLLPYETESVVIFDRYLLSMIVYQGGIPGRYMPLFCVQYEQMTSALPQPDVTIVLTASPEALMERAGIRREDAEGKSNPKDVMENEQRFRLQNYWFAMPRSWLPPGSRCIVVDSTEMTSDEVLDYVWERLEKLWPTSADSQGSSKMDAARAALNEF